MKYIRTKDRIILNPAPFNCGNNEFGTYMGEDARQANTIEELCDEFISVGGKSLGSHFRTDGYGLTNLLNQSELHKSILKELQGQGHRYYGAIWITGENGEPILKSVAKMNKKGELELI